MHNLHNLSQRQARNQVIYIDHDLPNVFSVPLGWLVFTTVKLLTRFLLLQQQSEQHRCRVHHDDDRVAMLGRKREREKNRVESTLFVVSLFLSISLCKY